MFNGGAYAETTFLGSADGSASVRIQITSALSVSFDYVIYVATAEFATEPTDTLPNQPFRGVLEQPLSFRRSILGAEIGVFSTGDGQLVINNSDEFYDVIIQLYAVDGRDVIIRVTSDDTPYDQSFVIFRGSASDWVVDEASLTIQLRDNGYKLDVPAQPHLYGGTGDADGETDLAQKRKPRAFGYVANVTPPLVDPALLIYQVNDGPIHAVAGVYDRGAGLTFGTDRADYAALAAAAPAASHYDTCLAEGFFKLGSTPAGTVTADVEGDKTGGVFVYTTADIVRRLVSTTTSLVDPDDFRVPSFTTLNTNQPSEVGYWLDTDDDSTVADVVARLMGGVGGWGGFRRDGSFEVRIFDAPTSGALAYFDPTDIIAIRRQPLPSSLTPPPWRWRVAYARAWTQQTDLAGTVSSARRAFVADPYRLAEASSTTILDDHPLAQDPSPIEAFFRDAADAQTEADRRLELYRTVRALYRLQLPRRALLLNVGDVINVTFPRWDLSAGRFMRIVEFNEDLAAPRDGNIDSVEIVAYG